MIIGWQRRQGFKPNVVNSTSFHCLHLQMEDKRMLFFLHLKMEAMETCENAEAFTTAKVYFS
jgi:hypothetical protein